GGAPGTGERPGAVGLELHAVDDHEESALAFRPEQMPRPVGVMIIIHARGGEREPGKIGDGDAFGDGREQGGVGAVADEQAVLVVIGMARGVLHEPDVAALVEAYDAVGGLHVALPAEAALVALD